MDIAKNWPYYVAFIISFFVIGYLINVYILNSDKEDLQNDQQIYEEPPQNFYSLHHPYIKEYCYNELVQIFAAYNEQPNLRNFAYGNITFNEHNTTLNCGADFMFISNSTLEEIEQKAKEYLLANKWNVSNNQYIYKAENYTAYANTYLYLENNIYKGYVNLTYDFGE